MKKAISLFCSSFLLASTMISALSATKIHHPDQDAGLAPTTTPPHLKYYGGVVISNIKLHSVLWGPNVNKEVAKNMLSYLPSLVGYEWIKSLSEYNTVGLSNSKNQTIGVGTFTGQTQINPANQKTYITDAEVSAELTSQIAAGKLPSPTLDANGFVETMYVVEFPPGVTIAMDATHASCTYFCAYHSSAVAKNGVTYTYSVQPDFSASSGCANGCGFGTMIENQQAVHCHEIVETITDPLIGKINGLTWYDEANGEIADICVAQQAHVLLNGKDYVVQKIWSNSANQCLAMLPEVSGTPTPVPPPVIPTPPTPTPTPTPSTVSSTASTIVASTPTFATSEILATTITVTLKTSSGAPVAGKSVSLSASSTWAVITPGSVVTNSAGMAQFTVFEGNTETVVFTAKTDNVVLAQTATVAFNTNLDPSIAAPVTASPVSLLANGIETSTITVTLQDKAGNPISGKKIAITQDGHSWIRTLSSVTNASGEAVFSIVNKTAETVTYKAKNTTDNTQVGAVSVSFQASGRSQFGNGYSDEELNRIVSADASSVVAASSVIGIENKVIIAVTLNTADGLPVAGREVSLSSSSPDHAEFFPVSGISDVAGMVTFVVSGNWKPETVFFSAYDVTDGISISQVAKVVFQGHIMLD